MIEIPASPCITPPNFMLYSRIRVLQSSNFTKHGSVCAPHIEAKRKGEPRPDQGRSCQLRWFRVWQFHRISSPVILSLARASSPTANRHSFRFFGPQEETGCFLRRALPGVALSFPSSTAGEHCRPPCHSRPPLSFPLGCDLRAFDICRLRNPVARQHPWF